MPLRKCPKCELNYILDEQPLCSVCTKEIKGMDHHDDEGEVCPICGEREVAAGEEYCAECLAEMKKLDSKHTAEAEEGAAEETEQLDVIEEIEDIPIDEAETAPPFELEHINEELGAEAEPYFDEEDEEILAEDEFPDDEEEGEELTEDENEQE